MSKLLAGFVLGIAFLGWFLYRLFIKRDLKDNLNDLWAGLFFLSIWGLIYWLFLD